MLLKLEESPDERVRGKPFLECCAGSIYADRHRL